MKLIAFTGPMGSGKSTAIQHLKDTNLERKIELVKFADPLYDIQEYAYRRIAEVYRRPETFTKDRKLLQWLGTEWGRGTISESIWTDLWKTKVSYIAENYPHAIVVCDDVRFDNEAALVKEFRGTVVKITTTKNEARIDTKAGIVNHASESGIDKKYVDFIIENDYSLSQFKDNLETIFDLTLNKNKKKD